jgi:hypothetical protein
MAAATTTVAVALSMVLFVMCANVIAVTYGRGVVRGALDEGVRVGARSGGLVAECEERVAQVLGQLLGGHMGQGVAYHCGRDGDDVVAAAEAVFPGWLPGIPDARFTIAARSVKEPEAEP